jgi:hypothetical protein
VQAANGGRIVDRRKPPFGSEGVERLQCQHQGVGEGAVKIPDDERIAFHGGILPGVAIVSEGN